MRPADISQIDGIWCFSFDRKAQKRIKTDAGVRKLPVHNELIRMGILDLATERAGEKTLLPDVPDLVYGVASHSPSRWGLDYLKHFLGIRNEDGEKFVNHGFRHTMETILKDIGTDEWLIHAIVGHKYHHVSDRYGKKPVRAINEAVQKIDFGVDLSHLYSGSRETPTRES